MAYNRKNGELSYYRNGQFAGTQTGIPVSIFFLRLSFFLLFLFLSPFLFFYSFSFFSFILSLSFLSRFFFPISLFFSPSFFLFSFFISLFILFVSLFSFPLYGPPLFQILYLTRLRYEQWTQKTKKKIPVVGEKEDASTVSEVLSAPKKYRHHKTKATDDTGLGLKTKEQIHKERKRKEKRKFQPKKKNKVSNRFLNAQQRNR